MKDTKEERFLESTRPLADRSHRAMPLSLSPTDFRANSILAKES